MGLSGRGVCAIIRCLRSVGLSGASLSTGNLTFRDFVKRFFHNSFKRFFAPGPVIRFVMATVNIGGS